MVRPWRFHLGAGALCLDFANTLSWRRSSSPIDRLGRDADLGSWARQAGVLSPGDELRWRRQTAARPRRSQQTLTMARSLRETIFRIFAALSERRPPAAVDLKSLEGWLQGAVRHSGLVVRNGVYCWEPLKGHDPLQRVLWSVALSAGELLSSAEAHRIGQCSGRDCRWLWIDRTRNNSRRWCDMAVCGNRAKARRHYARQHSIEVVASGPSPA